MFECNTQKEIPKPAQYEKIQEWINICKDELLQKKCGMVRCYEPMTESPHKLFLLLDSDDANAPDLVLRDFGDEWNIEVYPVNMLQEVLEQDHSIVAG